MLPPRPRERASSVGAEGRRDRCALLDRERYTTKATVRHKRERHRFSSSAERLVSVVARVSRASVERMERLVEYEDETPAVQESFSMRVNIDRVTWARRLCAAALVCAVGCSDDIEPSPTY
jgi:hypothetical protein